jgi:aconitase B
VKNRFQSLPFKRNLQRYNVYLASAELASVAAILGRLPTPEVGLCTLESS